VVARDKDGPPAGDSEDDGGTATYFTASDDDLADFLTDLQHLSRHAKADGLNVYSLQLR
jgi:hypothetical protein